MSTFDKTFGVFLTQRQLNVLYDAVCWVMDPSRDESEFEGDLHRLKLSDISAGTPDEQLKVIANELSRLGANPKGEGHYL